MAYQESSKDQIIINLSQYQPHLLREYAKMLNSLADVQDQKQKEWKEELERNRKEIDLVRTYSELGAAINKDWIQ